MKKFYAFAALALVVLGCQKSELEVDKSSSFAEREVTATGLILGSSADSKAYVDDNWGIYWSANQILGAWDNDYNSFASFSATNESGSTYAEFSGVISGEKLRFLHPYKADLVIEGGCTDISLTAQTVDMNTPKSHLTSNMYMMSDEVEVVEDVIESFEMKHVGSILNLNINFKDGILEGNQVNVTKVELLGVPVAGKLNLNASDIDGCLSELVTDEILTATISNSPTVSDGGTVTVPLAVLPGEVSELQVLITYFVGVDKYLLTKDISPESPLTIVRGSYHDLTLNCDAECDIQNFSLTGSGTVEAPYEVAEVADLELFAEIVNFGVLSLQTTEQAAQAAAQKAQRIQLMEATIQEIESLSTAAQSNSGAISKVTTQNSTLSTISSMQRTSELDDVTANTMYFKLTKDVDLQGSPEKQWTAIGTLDNPFYGHFEGNGKTVSGIYIDNSETYQGFFGYIREDAIVENLTVEGTIKSSNNVAGLVGRNYYGTITNCTNKVVVDGTAYIGGIVGYNFGGTISDCYNAGSVNGSSVVGGITGYSLYGSVTNSYNSASVNAGYGVGGMTGETWQTVFINCYNTGTITNTGNVAGGLIGTNASGSIINSFNLGTVEGTSSIGGLVGNNSGGLYINSYRLEGCSEIESGCGTEMSEANMKTSDFIDKLNSIASIYNGVNPDAYQACEWESDGGYPTLDLKNGAEPTPLEFDSGSGTSSSPYEISTKGKLEQLSYMLALGYDTEGKYFKLANDVNLNGSESDPWMVMGGTASQFKGSFDGGGHIVSGVYVNNSELYQGFFGTISESGSVSNLGIGGEITAGSYVGSVAGWNLGTITNCYNEAKISGGEYVGGLVGANSSTVANSYNTGSIVASSSYAGGLVGQNYGIIFNSYNIGEIKGASYVDGVTGYNEDCVIAYCYYLENTVTGTTASDYGTVKSETDMKDPDFLDILNSKASLYNGMYSNSPQACVWSQVSGSYPTFSFGDYATPVDIEVSFSGNGTSTSPYKISSADELLEFSGLFDYGYNSAGKYYELTTDIDLSEVCGESIGSWTPIGNSGAKFNGYFNGNEFEVKNIYISSSSDYQGLFSCTGTDAVIENLSVSGNVLGGSYLGCLVGNNWGSITNCYNSCSISGYATVGGIVGINGGSITNCYNAGLVTANYTVGGISGSNYNTISECYNSAAVNASNFAGGISGSSSSIINESYNTGSVSGSVCIGGITGKSSGGVVTNCYNSGAISATNYNVGGVAGYLQTSVISYCYNIGTVNCDYNNVGGVVGYNYGGSVVNSYRLRGCMTSAESCFEGSEVSSGEMQASSFVGLLNADQSPAPWESDVNPNINGGYPILSWQVE